LPLAAALLASACSSSPAASGQAAASGATITEIGAVLLSHVCRPVLEAASPGFA
jgi:hypothetical protein